MNRDATSDDDKTRDATRSWAPETHRIGPVAALRRHWYLVLLPAVILGAAAVVFSVQRAPTYSAETRLSVGRLVVSAPGAISGFAAATSSLASAYSRTIDADAITQPVARELGLSPAEVRRRVSATPIPESPVFRVIATGPTSRDAARLANAASRSVVDYVTELNQANPDSDRLRRQYRRQALRVEELNRELGRAKVRDGRNRTAGTIREVQDASVQAQLASVELGSIRANYQTSQQSQAATELVQFVQPAQSGASDRSRTLQFGVFAGVVAGLLLGGVFALCLESRRYRRLAAAR